MNSLVDRLRAVAENQSRVTGGVVRVRTNVFTQAADEIERLEARNARLLLVLKGLFLLHGKPMRGEWMNDEAFKYAKSIHAEAREVITSEEKEQSK